MRRDRTPRRDDRDLWDAMLPGSDWSRRRRSLANLFEAIAPTYDRLNRILSLGLDRGWRLRAAREAIEPSETGFVLDLASGTADLAVAALRRAPGCRPVRLDLSLLLLRQARGKIPPEACSPSLVAEMERLPARDGSCAAITMGFALRHVDRLDRLLAECARVLAPGGRVAFVDMGLPERGPWAVLYRLYFRRCLPRLAALLGGERRAYELMVRSVESFPGWTALAQAARGAGLHETRLVRLAGGAARVFVARKTSGSPDADRDGALRALERPRDIRGGEAEAERN